MDRRALLLLFGATLAWSTSGLFARAIALDTPTVILWRGLAGAAGLLVTLVVMKGWGGLADFGRLGRAGWLYALCSGVGMLLFVGSLKATTIAHVAIIYATVPFAAAALGWLVLRERPSRAAVVASGLALTGSVVMVGLGGDGRWQGDLMALGMVAAMAATGSIASPKPSSGSEMRLIASAAKITCRPSGRVRCAERWPGVWPGVAIRRRPSQRSMSPCTGWHCPAGQPKGAPLPQ